MQDSESFSLVKKYFEDQQGDRIYFWEGPFSPINYTFGWNDQKFYTPYKTEPFSVLVAITGRDSHILFNDVSYSGYGREVFQDYWNHGHLADQLQKVFQATKQETQEWHDLVVQLDIKELTDTQILTFITKCANLYGILLGCSLYVETFDEEIALSVIGEKDKDIITDIWGKVTHPYFESFEARRLRSAVSLLKKKTKNAAQLYQYSTTDFFMCKPLPETEAKLSAIQADLKLHKSHLARESEKRQEEFTKYSQWLGTLSADKKRLATYTQMVMEIRDQRKDPYNQLQTIQSILGQELLVRAKIDPTFTPYLVASDLTNGLQTLIEKKSEFPKRPDGFVAFYGENGQLTSVTENITDTLAYIEQKHLEQEAELGIEQIKGLVGSKGIARGFVCIVPDVTRAEHFRDGDVLVTGMTRPEFAPYMKRACAIVTDEGGITCHAAIVSRELRIPCLIGTKIATKILKNGDHVEVDANHGFVKILKKAEA